MDLDGQQVLVTGGCGFIGSHLCERLVKIGAKVSVLDNLSSGERSNLSEVHEQIDLYEGSIVNETAVQNAVEGCDVVIHEAYPYGKADWGVDGQYVDEGILGTTNLLKEAVKQGVSKFVFASSVAVYGIQDSIPVDEDHPAQPFVPYGVTKRAGEEYCRTFSTMYDIDTVSLRYFYVYGPRYASFDHSAMVKFLNRALSGEPLTVYGEGQQLRDYTYIDDIVDGTVQAAETDGTDGTVYNLSSGEGVSVIELAESIAAIADGSVDVEFTDVPDSRYDDEYCQIPRGMTTKVDGEWIDQRSYVGNIQRARTELGYEPTTDLETGIRQTLNWMEEKET